MMQSVKTIAAECAARETCDGCRFAKRIRVCPECGEEVASDDDDPECAAEVDGLEPYLWPLQQFDLFSPPEFIEKHQMEFEALAGEGGEEG